MGRDPCFGLSAGYPLAGGAGMRATVWLGGVIQSFPPFAALSHQEAQCAYLPKGHAGAQHGLLPFVWFS